MKAFLVLLVIAALFLRLAVEKAPAAQRIHEPLSEGTLHLALRKIGHRAPMETGAPIIFRTNYSAAGVVKGFNPSFRFDDGEIASAVLVRWNHGLIKWVKREQLCDAYTTEAATSAR
jgi:hypothetical protein